jgi:hypothetical protein
MKKDLQPRKWLMWRLPDDEVKHPTIPARDRDFLAFDWRAYIWWLKRIARQRFLGTYCRKAGH